MKMFSGAETFVAVKATMQVTAFAVMWDTLASQLPDYTLLVAFSGMCGGFCRWMLDRERFWPNGLTTVLSAMIVPVFLWPVGEKIAGTAFGALNLEPSAAVMLGGFITGLMSVGILGFIVDTFRTRRNRLGGSHDQNQ